MPPQAGFNSIMDLFPFLVIFLIFYVLVFKPQKEKQKQLKKTIDSLKKNDEIVTTCGVHATVVNVKENTVIVRIDDNARMEIDKQAVATVKVK